MRPTTPATGPGVQRPSGVVRAAGFAALCVLLPLLGQRAFTGHLPSGIALWGFIAFTGAAAAFFARRPLSHQQALAALAGAQLAFHAAYTLPGACAAAGSRTAALWLEHTTGSNHPGWEMPAAHAVVVVLAVRLLGVADALRQPLCYLIITVRERAALVRVRNMQVCPALPLIPVDGPRAAPTGFRAPPRRPVRAPPRRRQQPRTLLPIRLVPGGGALPA
ncbi:hypothetical protein KQY30_33775 [Streptomyces sp. GMY02]|uniref:hypothetical protein n=1 Tax=Streptomyces sp. GMY02 TaxID=1333528 RepID=UPI001C2B8265|nr:hypothetical protein [Streptomyces sp. GMY02]QXE38467.1 hypothetical protein KQY30_33775 [Streptomyces sp. GMY02]